MHKSKKLLAILLILFSSACFSEYIVTQDQMTRTNDSLSKTITYSENLQNQINTNNKQFSELTSVNDFNKLIDTSNSHVSITNSTLKKMQTELNTLTATKLNIEDYNLGIKKLSENSQKTYDELNDRLNDLQNQINSNNLKIGNLTSLISKNTSSISKNTSSIKDNISDINNLEGSVMIKTEIIKTTDVLTVGEIQSEFGKNSSLADLKYKNLNTILIKGMADNSLRYMGALSQDLKLSGLKYDEDDYYVTTIYANFWAVKIDEAKKMQKGNFITVNCKYDQYNGRNAEFDECSLIQ